jgi:hypothetical protein
LAAQGIIFQLELDLLLFVDKEKFCHDHKADLWVWGCLEGWN